MGICRLPGSVERDTAPAQLKERDEDSRPSTAAQVRPRPPALVALRDAGSAAEAERSTMGVSHGDGPDDRADGRPPPPDREHPAHSTRVRVCRISRAPRPGYPQLPFSTEQERQSMNERRPPPAKVQRCAATLDGTCAGPARTAGPGGYWIVDAVRHVSGSRLPGRRKAVWWPKSSLNPVLELKQPEGRTASCARHRDCPN